MVLCYLISCQYPARADIPTLSLHDALPISRAPASTAVLYTVSKKPRSARVPSTPKNATVTPWSAANDTAYTIRSDRKSTRLNSSHVSISYAVFCLKKKKEQTLERKASKLVA